MSIILNNFKKCFNQLYMSLSKWFLNSALLMHFFFCVSTSLVSSLLNWQSPACNSVKFSRWLGKRRNSWSFLIVVSRKSPWFVSYCSRRGYVSQIQASVMRSEEWKLNPYLGKLALNVLLLKRNKVIKISF